VRVEELELGGPDVGLGGNVELLEDHRLIGHHDPQHFAQSVEEEACDPMEKNKNVIIINTLKK
jgi:hypothetical protein